MEIVYIKSINIATIFDSHLFGLLTFALQFLKTIGKTSKVKVTWYGKKVIKHKKIKLKEFNFFV